MRELKPLALLPEADAYDVFQAPRSAREAEAAFVPVSYAEILLGCGYRDAGEIAALVGGWRTLLSQWRADLLVADFAPTALLAARTMQLPRVTYGNGFFNPPRLSPLPPFRVDTPVDPARVAAADAAVLAQVNAAMARLGAPPLARLADQFEANEDFLCTFPELDHYGTRGVSGFWGPRLRTDLGNPMDWPEGRGKRLLVYVQSSLPQLDALIAQLAASPHRVIAYIPGLDEMRRARLAGRGRVVIERPVRLDLLLRQCDLLVCHGGEIAGGAVASGVPVLLFPTHYEQFLTAVRLQQLGAGGWIAPDGTLEQVRTGLDAMTGEARYQASARAFAQRYSAWSPTEQRRRIVVRIEEILGARAPSPILTPSSPPTPAP
jgi:UDP:flavonoid glycosyltransferase YjiC (YdhE family)